MDHKDIRNKTIHIAFSENEISQIDKYCKHDKIKLTSRTEFIRQAIFDKIRRIENPEVYNHTNKKFDVDQISEFLKEIKASNEQQQEILRRLIIVDQIQTNFKVLKNMAKQPEMEKNEKIIIELLTKHKKLKPLKIMDLSGLSSHKVYDVISNDNVFSINMNGEVVLKNGE
ncbi:hypothetical protein ES703_108923 [subsurface metagenome]